MPNTIYIDRTTAYTISTLSDTDNLDTYTIERAATLLTKELQTIDSIEMNEGIRNLTIDSMTCQEPNTVKSFLGSGIQILVYDRTNTKISQQSLRFPK